MPLPTLSPPPSSASSSDSHSTSIVRNNPTHPTTRFKPPAHQAHLHAPAHGHPRVGPDEGSIREASPLSPAPTAWFGNAWSGPSAGLGSERGYASPCRGCWRLCCLAICWVEWDGQWPSRTIISLRVSSHGKLDWGLLSRGSGEYSTWRSSIGSSLTPQP